MSRFVIIALLLIFSEMTSAQMDSITLKTAKLGIENIDVRTSALQNQEVLSASRSLKRLSELPMTIHIVTKEEILANGYVTLVDVLKSAPGIRVSQPGSALEGETFLMRGLIGNTYTKILINDVPIKPSTVSGMPLGAQLPIRQAERIEIIYGPAAAIYGADAVAGVINIILKETERPIFAQANLSLGVNGYTNLDIMFGGKLGKNKNILRYSVFGNFTDFDNYKTIYDEEELYNPQFYAGDTTADIRAVAPNYVGLPRKPLINDLPHLSKMIGFRLSYRALEISSSSMYRRDHSAIGLSPTAESYTNSSNFTGESINQFNVAIKKDYNKFGFKTSLFALLYELDNRSSSTYIYPAINQLIDAISLNGPLSPADADTLQQVAYETFFSNTRYRYASSLNATLEQLFTFHPTDNIEIVSGANADVYLDRPYSSFLNRPYDSDDIFNISDPTLSLDSIFPREQTLANVGAFVQGYFTSRYLNIMCGIRYDNFQQFGETVNPRLALLYKIKENLSVRGSYATAFRKPSTFYTANTYTIDPFSLEFKLGNPRLKSESSVSTEFGIRWNQKNKFITDISLFYTKQKNFISFNGTFNNTLSGNSKVLFGYVNDSNSSMELYGIQSKFILQDFLPRFIQKIEFNLALSEGQETLPFDKGQLSMPRMQPRMLGQLKLVFRPKEKIYIHLQNTFQSKAFKRQVLEVPDFDTELAADYETKGFYTMDFLVRTQISSFFQIFLQIRNVFSKKYAGLGASGTFDDLYYNPQALRTTRIGLSYSMN